MPIFDLTVPGYKPRKFSDQDWDNFRKGLNTLLKDTEIGDDELAQADNIVLIGRGVPTKRWGYTMDFLSGATGAVRGLSGYYLVDGTNELVSITDHGYLSIKSNASYTTRTGASWASGYNANITQLDDDLYIVNGQRELVRYSTPTLTGFPTISIPAGTFATQISGASGTNTYSYRVSAKSNVGETLASGAYEVANQPQSLTDGTIEVSWTAVSTASGVLTGYNIYGRNTGDERFLGSVSSDTLTYLDDGSTDPAAFTFPPTADSTGGIIAKYIGRLNDRLVYAGIDGEPSKVVFSGRVPLHERNDVASGGNFIRIEPDAGDDITGLAIFGDRTVVFKERSIWEITLSTLTVGNFVITQPSVKLITASHGCIAPRSIAAVENDIFFLSRKGVYVLGYEPNLAIDVLRTNELSAKVRPFFDARSTAQKEGAVASYFGTKFVISFPGTDKSMVYDRERLSWVGPWMFDTKTFHTYYDANNDEKYLLGEETGPNVYELKDSYGDDNGTTIKTTLRTRNTDFGNWTVFKLIKDQYTNWRNVTGSISVDLQLEDRTGRTIAAKNFTITTREGNAGWGADLWGNTQWGDSEETGGAAEDVDDLVRWVRLYKPARRMQLIVKTSNRNDNYELLAVRTFAHAISRGLKGDDWRVA